jgi:hypothetical protein
MHSSKPDLDKDGERRSGRKNSSVGSEKAREDRLAEQA